MDWMRDSAPSLNYPKGPLDIIFSQGRRNRNFLLTTLVIRSCNTAKLAEYDVLLSAIYDKVGFSQSTFMAVPLIFHTNAPLTFVGLPTGNLSVGFAIMTRLKMLIH